MIDLNRLRSISFTWNRLLFFITQYWFDFVNEKDWWVGFKLQQGIWTPSHMIYSKTCVKWSLSKRPKIGLQDQLSLNAGQKYCRMLQGEHSAKLSTFIELPFVTKIFVMSIFEWPFYTGFTVFVNNRCSCH